MTTIVSPPRSGCHALLPMRTDFFVADPAQGLIAIWGGTTGPLIRAANEPRGSREPGYRRPFKQCPPFGFVPFGLSGRRLNVGPTPNRSDVTRASRAPLSLRYLKAAVSREDGP